MKLSKEQAAKNRQRIVEESVCSFKSRGVDAVGVNEIMKAAGFTHGGFYNHFESREALIAEAFAAAFEPSVAVVEKVAECPREFARTLNAYLSIEHRDDPAHGCPTSALVVDAARQSQLARKAYAEGIARFLKAFESRMPGPVEQAGEAAMVTLAGMVGAMVLARGVGDANPTLSESILKAAQRETASRLGSEDHAEP